MSIKTIKVLLAIIACLAFMWGDYYFYHIMTSDGCCDNIFLLPWWIWPFRITCVIAMLVVYFFSFLLALED